MAKRQLDHSYTFWAMSIMIFSPFTNFGNQSLASVLEYFFRIIKKLPGRCVPHWTGVVICPSSYVIVC